jgi:LPS-assembly protein
MSIYSRFISVLVIFNLLLLTLLSTASSTSVGKKNEVTNKLNAFKNDEDSLATLDEKPPIILNAEKIDYNQETHIVNATGNVQVVQGNRTLRANKIIYNKITGQMSAYGNVCLRETERRKLSANSLVQAHNEFLSHQDYVLNRLMQSGTIVSNPLNLPQLGKQINYSSLSLEEQNNLAISNYNLLFFSSAEFSNELQDATIENAKVLTADDARIASNFARRIQGKKTIFRQAVYSPCNVCKINPKKMPLWQLKADKIIHSKTDQIIIYHHARLEISGVPVFYLPYFRHADGTVKRKTGFLMPAYGSISDLGLIVSTPFYYDIAPNRDLTLSPIITTKQGPIMVAEYRHRFRDGDFTASTSYTQTRDLKHITKGSKLPGKDRWHIYTQGRFELNDESVATFDINRASDTTYLRRYPIFPQGFRLKYPTKNMASTASLEQFQDHNYGVVRATVFQTDNPNTTPYLLPHAWYNYQTDPGQWNGIWNFDANLLSLGRRRDTPGRNARHMQRLSLTGGWRVPYVTSTGHIWVLNMTMRSDSYALEHYQPATNKPVLSSTFKGRFFPTASAQWRYPLIKRLSYSDWVLEPTAMIVGTTRVNNSSIPNEDSLNVQIEDTSLFLAQRFSGLDRVDTGGRFIYGGNSTWFFPQKRLIQIFLGQSIRIDKHQVLPSRFCGEDKRASDIVSRLRVNPIQSIQILNRMAMDKNRLRPRISDTSAIFGKKFLIFQLNHTYVNKKSTVNDVGISQATWIVGSNPVEHWSFSLGETRNLKKHQRGALSHTVSALYHDECFRMTLSAFKTRSLDRDIRPNSGFIVQFDFKNLGSIDPLGTLGINANNLL